jgi:hypothetical protein
MGYRRTNDIMDSTVFSVDKMYKPKNNPKASISGEVEVIPQSNEDIIDFVVSQMKDTIGNNSASESH